MKPVINGVDWDWASSVHDDFIDSAAYAMMTARGQGKNALLQQFMNGNFGSVDNVRFVESK